jgi:spore maturation protein CgeB
VFFAGSNRRRRKADGVSWRWDFPGGEFRFQSVVEANRRFKLYLVGEKKQWPFKVHPLKDHVDYYREFLKARVILSANQYELQQYYPRRIFHAGASGRMLLTRYIPWMENDFTRGLHLDWYRSLRELVSKLTHYTKERCPDRDRIAKAGREHFLKRHSWRARLAEFEQLVDMIRKR